MCTQYSIFTEKKIALVLRFWESGFKMWEASYPQVWPWMKKEHKAVLFRTL